MSFWVKIILFFFCINLLTLNLTNSLKFPFFALSTFILGIWRWELANSIELGHTAFVQSDQALYCWLPWSSVWASMWPGAHKKSVSSNCFQINVNDEWNLQSKKVWHQFNKTFVQLNFKNLLIMKCFAEVERDRGWTWPWRGRAGLW